MILKPLTEVYPYSNHLSLTNERSGIIDRVKQDNIDYRGIPDERINSSIHKIQDTYYIDETKLKDQIPDYNLNKRLLDITV